MKPTGNEAPAFRPGRRHTLAILHAGNKAEVRWLRSEGECEDLVAQQEVGTLTIEGSPVTQVECQCVTFDQDGNEASQ